MLNKKGQTIFFEKPPYIEAFASVVGKKEANGPLKEYFDVICMDSLMGQKSYEKAEAQFQNTAVSRAITKAGKSKENIEYLLGGDLLNQCIGSAYGLREFDIPFLGLYGACSTIIEGLGLSAVLCGSGAAKRVCNVSSSHFCSAERQFRFPLSYGGQRTPTNQWTVTGAGAIILAEGKKEKCTKPFINAVTFGKIEDLGVTDINNMGAAMAPAAASTISAYFKDSGKNPEEFDLILTGDLGVVGSDLLTKLLLNESIDISRNHNDCGKMIYDIGSQDVHSGGSGCGCCASVLCSKVLRGIESGAKADVLVIATGALMSTVSVQQGESIPSVAHLVHISKRG